MSTLLSSFRATICAEPDNMDARLVYADAIDEQGNEIVCPKCHGVKEEGNKFIVQGTLGSGGGHIDESGFEYRPGEVVFSRNDLIAMFSGKFTLLKEECPECLGKRLVPDQLKARAEFIRVQIELSKLPPPLTVLTPTEIELDAIEPKVIVLQEFTIKFLQRNMTERARNLIPQIKQLQEQKKVVEIFTTTPTILWGWIQDFTLDVPSGNLSVRMFRCECPEEEVKYRWTRNDLVERQRHLFNNFGWRWTLEENPNLAKSVTNFPSVTDNPAKWDWLDVWTYNGSPRVHDEIQVRFKGGDWITYRKGFVEEVRAWPTTWLPHAEQVRSETPIKKVILRNQVATRDPMGLTRRMSFRVDKNPFGAEEFSGLRKLTHCVNRESFLGYKKGQVLITGITAEPALLFVPERTADDDRPSPTWLIDVSMLAQKTILLYDGADFAKAHPYLKECSREGVVLDKPETLQPAEDEDNEGNNTPDGWDHGGD